MPGWHKKLAPYLKSGEIIEVGLIQEQHPDRCKLFMQWKKMQWPVMVDSLNILGLSAVPITLAIDEWGVVRMVRPKFKDFVARFIKTKFEKPAGDLVEAPAKPDLAKLKERADEDGAWRDYGDALFLWGGAQRSGETITAYRSAVRVAPQDAPARFRLGVALRRRFDSDARVSTDFKHAASMWESAQELDPNNYIWRRRLQQYGPRLEKPYPFYDWVPTARDEIKAQGGDPVELTTEPSGAEFATRIREFESDPGKQKQPDPKGKIHRDLEGLIDIQSVVIPGKVAPGKSTRVHLQLLPTTKEDAHWNNEAGQLQVWVEAPKGWGIDRRLLSAPNGDGATDKKARSVEFELKVPAKAGAGEVTLKAYALYYVCKGSDGICLYLRQDLEIKLSVRK